MNLLVLMDTHEVEPVVLLPAGLEEFDFVVTKCPEQSLISNIAHTIQSKFGLAFLQ